MKKTKLMEKKFIFLLLYLYYITTAQTCHFFVYDFFAKEKVKDRY